MYRMKNNEKDSQNKNIKEEKKKHSQLENDLLTPLDENLWDKTNKEEEDLDDILDTPIIPGTSGIDC